MTGRQRILAALSHQPVDRVPIDLGGTRQSGISVFAYVELLKRLGIRRTPRVFDTFQMLAEIDEDVLAHFRTDTVSLNRRAVAFGIANDAWKPMQLRGIDVLVPAGFNPERDGGDLVLRKAGQVVARMPEHGFYFDRYEPYPGATHPDLSTWSAPRLSEPDLEHFARESRRIADASDRCVVAAFGPPYELFNGIGQGGFEQWMITFATEDEYVEQLYTMLVDAWIENLSAFHRVVGERVQVIQIADDLGTQAGPFLSVAMFREKVMPHYARGLKWIHNHTPWKVLMHSDGAIRPLIPSLIEAGVDALNPVQTSCPGMGPASLRAEFGGRIAFWGGSVDAQGTLVRGTPDAVAREATTNLQQFATLSGGHVFASIHNVQADVPPGNVAALFDAAQRFNTEVNDA
jgi:uroporphyrinogen decarboxylase